MNLILIGMPKSGKSTVGKILSKKLGWKHIDTDKLIEKSYHVKTNQQLSCREIFRKEGEANFRLFEKEHILSITSNNLNDFTIISTGGGALIDVENREHLKNNGRCIFLNVSTDVLWKRILKRGIPTYLNAENPYKSFVELVQTRYPLYETIADMTINTDHLAPEQTAFLVIKRLKLSYIPLKSQIKKLVPINSS